MALEGSKQLVSLMFQNKLSEQAAENAFQRQMQLPGVQQQLMVLKQAQEREQRQRMIEQKFMSGDLKSGEDFVQAQAYVEGGIPAVMQAAQYFPIAQAAIAKRNKRIKAGEDILPLNFIEAFDIAQKQGEVTLEAQTAGAKAQATEAGRTEAQLAAAEDVAKAGAQAEMTRLETTWPQRNIEMTRQAELDRWVRSVSGGTERGNASIQRNRESQWRQIEQNTLLFNGNDATQEEVDKARTFYMENGVLPDGYRMQKAWKMSDGRVPSSEIYQENKAIVQNWIADNWSKVPKKVKDKHGLGWLNWKSDPDKAAEMLADNPDLWSEVKMPEAVRNHLEIMGKYLLNQKTSAAVNPTPLTPGSSGVKVTQTDLDAYREKYKDNPNTESYIQSQLASGKWQMQ